MTASSSLSERHGFARVQLAHTPTPLEPLERLSAELGGPEIWVKRDDCTGLAMGGNKARQLEYYFGAAVSEGADTVLITSATQSNFMRMTAAAAARLGMCCELQSESRVPGMSGSYKTSGNVLLDRVLGANIHAFPGEGIDDEKLMDESLDKRAEVLRAEGKKPYVIHLGASFPPLGALGYVDAGLEVAEQAEQMGLAFDAVVVASGSALTHVGLLAGLRLAGSQVPVLGACVRRAADVQSARVGQRAQDLSRMLGRQGLITEDEVTCFDNALGEGYGRMGQDTFDAIALAARTEGLLLDPVYTGKTLASLIALTREGRLSAGQRVLFMHTGGTPALFAYQEGLEEHLEA